MNDEEALLNALRAQPDDDALRLVFADALQESGDDVGAAWAELIRGQIELANAAAARNEETAARMRVLDVHSWHVRWLARMGYRGGGVVFGEWVRGFPEGATASASELFANWANLARVPFERLRMISATDATVEELVTRPELAPVRALFLDTGSFVECLGERTFRALAGCPHLAHLRMLDACSAALTDGAAEAIIASPHLVALGGFAARPLTPHRDRVTISPDTDRRLHARFARNRRSWT
jgi:uncharacterized protein (TIGR02996 family)